jgi:hypothetical protein
VPHVRIQRLGARHREEHGAENDERQAGMRREQLDGVPGIDRDEYPRRLHDFNETQHGERGKPQHHDGSEQPAHFFRTAPLDGKQHHDDTQRHGNHRARQIGIQDLQALDSAEHGNGRRDQRVAIEQRRSQHSQRHRATRPRLGGAKTLLDQSHEREDAALACVVRSHDDGQVLHTHDDGQCPEHQ